MARMPGTVWLGEHSPKRRMVRYDIVCVHTIVGFAPAHAAHFSVKADGTIQQSRDTAFQSAGNLNGNPRVIVIENEDHGPAFPKWSGSDVPRLTDAQVKANARILAWAHKQHGIPLQLCPNSRPNSRGLAYHRQGIDGNFNNGRVSGGEVWTNARGKVCPGDRRIAQLPDILAEARKLADPAPAVKPKPTLTRGPVIDEVLADVDKVIAKLATAKPSKGNAVLTTAALTAFRGGRATLRRIAPFTLGGSGKARRR